MNKSRLALTTLSLVIAAAAGCGSGTNVNVNVNGNANGNVNANANRTANANANAANLNANRPLNANVTREEYERDRSNYEQEARRLGRTIGSGANDLWIWTKTRAALGTADDLRDSTINVDVENDVVTLTGSVGSAQQKTRAGQLAQGIEGVKRVANNLTVSAGGDANRNAAGNGNANTRN